MTTHLCRRAHPLALGLLGLQLGQPGRMDLHFTVLCRRHTGVALRLQLLGAAVGRCVARLGRRALLLALQQRLLALVGALRLADG